MKTREEQRSLQKKNTKNATFTPRNDGKKNTKIKGFPPKENKSSSFSMKLPEICARSGDGEGKGIELTKAED